MKLPFAAALALCLAGPLAAQTRVRPMPATGELIRVSPAGETPWTGTVAALGGDSLILRTDGDGARLVLLSAQPVEIHRSRREHWSGLGALLGGVAGLGLSAMSGGSTGSAHGADRLIVSAAGGAVFGGVLGFGVAPRRWRLLRVTALAHAAPAPGVQ
jgi:hypothetical protein